MSGNHDRIRGRLATVRIFTAMMRNDNFRRSFAERSGWTPNSPIVPCESNTLFGEVYEMAIPALDESGATVAAIPVLAMTPQTDDSDDKLTLSLTVVSLRKHVSGEATPEDAIDIDSISHEVTMAQVCETLAPAKKWDISDCVAPTSTTGA